MMSDVMDVLIVEDEMLLTMDIEAMVEECGHHVLAEAANLKEVEKLSSEIRPQLAFVDLHLADETSGLDVCRLIQQRWPQALIVFVTANVSKVPADFAGAHGIIAKPFSHSGVTNAIRYLADGIFDPPPSMPPPSSLVTSAHLERRWAET